jgi:hypothetical protein
MCDESISEPCKSLAVTCIAGACVVGKPLLQIFLCAGIFLIGKIDASDNVGIPHHFLQPLFALRATPGTASPKSMVLPVAVRRVAPSGRSVVLPRGKTSNRAKQLQVVIKDLVEIYKFPPQLDGKSFQWESLPVRI